MEWIFGGLMVFGLLYLLLMIFGSALELGDVDGLMESTGMDSVFGLDTPDAAEISGLGCSVIAAFLAGFGAVGLAGTLSGWSLVVSLIGAVLIGLVFGRVVVQALVFVYRQQTEAVGSIDRLIGESARVTIDSAPGKTGEAIIESGEITKYPIREINDAELRRGDTVEVVNVQGRVLQVKKKRG